MIGRRAVCAGMATAAVFVGIVGVLAPAGAQTGQNNARRPSARSGVVVGGNVALLNAGPSADGVVGGASATQTGDDTSFVSQTTTLRSGDAIAGGQTGAAGIGIPSNSAVGARAATGDVVGGNGAVAAAGPSARSAIPAGAASQIGDSTSDVRQTTTLTSGDAASGSIGRNAAATVPATPWSPGAVLAMGVAIGVIAATLVQSPWPRLSSRAAASGPRDVFVPPDELAQALGVPLYRRFEDRDTLAALWGEPRHVDLADPHADVPRSLETGRAALVYLDRGGSKRPVAVWAS